MYMPFRRLVPSFSSRRFTPRLVRSYTDDSSFSHITASQWEQISKYEAELLEWNKKINLISRKDAAVPGKIMSGHILPCLSISILRPFLPGESVLDAG
jgi:16S rRNA G527 N7-methylase RsmG